jgi:hypothetical protein
MWKVSDFDLIDFRLAHQIFYFETPLIFKQIGGNLSLLFEIAGNKNSFFCLQVNS